MTLTQENAIMFAQKYLNSNHVLTTNNQILTYGNCLSDAVQYAYYASTPKEDIPETYTATINGATFNNTGNVYREPENIGLKFNKSQRNTATTSTREQTAKIVIKYQKYIEGKTYNVVNDRKTAIKNQYNIDDYMKNNSKSSYSYIWSEDDMLFASSILLNKIIFVIPIDIQSGYKMIGPVNMVCTPNNIIFIINSGNGHYETFYMKNTTNERDYISATDQFVKLLNKLKKEPNFVTDNLEIAVNAFKGHNEEKDFSLDKFPLDSRPPQQKSSSVSRRVLIIPQIVGIQTSNIKSHKRNKKKINIPRLNGISVSFTKKKRRRVKLKIPRIN
jgi:hypothetical protein